MAKFTFTIDTGHAPMIQTREIAKALESVAALVEPWGTLWSSGRDVIGSDGVRVGAWTYTDEVSS